MAPSLYESAAVQWTLQVDGSSNSRGSGPGVILENSEGLMVDVSLSFSFDTSNNQAEFEACIVGLKLVSDFGAWNIELNTDSLLVVSQVNKEFVANDLILQRYLAKVRDLLLQFDQVKIKHVSRAQNARVDVLSKLANTNKGGNLRNIIQENLKNPSVDLFSPSKVELCAAEVGPSWIKLLKRYIESGLEPLDLMEAAVVRRKSTFYSLVDGKLFRRGFSMPLLRCVERGEAHLILEEIHGGVCGQHLGARALAKKALQASYYWPTMIKDAAEYVKRCDTCQRYTDVHNAPPVELSSLTSFRPFAQWGIDFLCPFAPGRGGVKYLIVGIDYLTKWIEPEPFANITAANCIRFFKRSILTRFGVPSVLISDNDTQFMDKTFLQLMTDLGVNASRRAQPGHLVHPLPTSPRRQRTGRLRGT